MNPDIYEKLGSFYLGRHYDIVQRELTEPLLLYDAKDLTTHAVCVGMTGSGKTGLCLSLLEEAAIDGVPAIAIDPKGDLGNLLLTFPELKAQDFRPWIDESEARRKGMTPEEFAADRAALWKRGLADWGQDGERIARFKDAVDISIYTPGSDAGVPLTIMRSFDAPPEVLRDDEDAVRDRVLSAVSGLLELLGIDADPIRSPEHILLSNIITHAWEQGRNLDLPGIIKEIQEPSVKKIGVFDLESFFPAKDRFEFAMAMNSLLAAPSFSAWMSGEPLDIERLLHTADGKPRISIISIAHLSDAERMFFVTLLLNEVVSWMRTKPGTSSLRAILYMDEIFGFFPPTAKPPSKTPMLTLLKQARAYGLGVVLATQNPVDLDYKGLSNAGTWFIGRLQTERDKKRVLEGLEGASIAAGSSFDRKQMDTILAALGSRVFLMNNVHNDEPMLFHTRWALSYLRGPLTRTQIQTLMSDRRSNTENGSTETQMREQPQPEQVAKAVALLDMPPPLPPEIARAYLPISTSRGADDEIIYRPAALGVGRMHYVRRGADIDYWKEIALLHVFDEQAPDDPWIESRVLDSASPKVDTEPAARCRFASLPSDAANPREVKSWTHSFVDHLYREHPLPVWHCPLLKEYSKADESPEAYRERLERMLDERRGEETERLNKRYESKLESARDRIDKAEQRVETEKSQMRQHWFQTIISAVTTIFGVLGGRKAASRSNVSKAGTTLRGAGRATREHGDVSRARQTLNERQDDLQELEADRQRDLADIDNRCSIDSVEIEEILVRPRKSDMSTQFVGLAWIPYRRDASGREHAAFSSDDS